MDKPGQRLKQVRERLDLRYRDVEDASLRIADRRKNDEFVIALSRLADIENKGTVPSIYKLYSLCAIYRLEIFEVLQWYGVDLSQVAADSAEVEIESTHLVGFQSHELGEVQLPLQMDAGADLEKTTFLSRMVQRWGRLPLLLLNRFDLKAYRYGYVGTEDWSMYPLIQPGALVLIDESKRRIVTSGWASEFERPIYFLEYKEGFACGWCHLDEKSLVLQPHPASPCSPRTFRFPDEIDVIGQVVGVAMRYEGIRRRGTGIAGS